MGGLALAVGWGRALDEGLSRRGVGSWGLFENKR